VLLLCLLKQKGGIDEKCNPNEVCLPVLPVRTFR
jgi:hypothetical protein